MTAVRRLAERRSTIARVLGAAAALLVLAHVAWQLVKHWTGHDVIFGLVKLFHLDEERNVPTTFSALLLLSAAGLLAWIALHVKGQGGRDASKWTLLALGFVYLAVDEFGHIHESLIVPGRELLGYRAAGIFYYAWVVPASVVVLVLAAFFLPFMLRLPVRARVGFTLAGALFVCGAIGFEMLEGRHDHLYGEHNLTYMAYVTIEESLEMAGVIVFIHALLDYIATQLQATTANAGPRVVAMAAQAPRRART